MTENSSSPSKKLGVMYLDQLQLNSAFPDWRALLDRIEEQREIAALAHSLKYQMEEHLPQTYDNIFAVLGDRGTGKSSVVLTLREHLNQSPRRDILFPIITPEIISEQKCSILGWILSAAESIVEQIEERAQFLARDDRLPSRVGSDCLDSFFKDCQFQKDNRLRREYRALFKKSIETSGELDVSNYSVEDAVSYRLDQSRKQYKLMRDLNRFWNLLTETWSKVFPPLSAEDDREAQLKCGCCRPLIILLFDDIDLVPERSMELLTVTFQYLANPNIAIILSASEKALKDVLRIKMIERMVGSDASSLLIDLYPTAQKRDSSSSHKTSALRVESIEKMAQEFYDKVVPPSCRYYLRRYGSIAEKRRYAYSNTDQSFRAPGNNNASILLGDFLRTQLIDLRKAFAGDDDSTPVFLAEGKNGAFQDAYLLIFGEKSRNISNGCLEIMNSFARLKQVGRRKAGESLAKEDYDEILLILRYLLRALLLSKPCLNEYANQTESLIYPASEWDRVGIFVNYQLPLQNYRDELQDIYSRLADEDQAEPDGLIRMKVKLLGIAKKKTAALMTVLFFIEGTLLTIDPTQKRIHGYRYLHSLINSDVMIEQEDDIQRTRSHSLFPQHRDVSQFLRDSPYALEHIDRYVGIDPYDRQYAQRYLEDVFHASILGGTAPAALLNSAVRGDRDWVKAVLTTLAVRYSGITMVEPNFVHVLAQNRKTLELFSFSALLNKRIESSAQNFLAKSDLFQESEKQIDLFGRHVDKNDYMSADRYNWEDTAKSLKDTIFSNVDFITLEGRNNQIEAALSDSSLKIPYMNAFLCHRWNSFIEAEEDEPAFPSAGLSARLRHSYEIVHFFEDTLNRCARELSTQTNLYLTDSAISTIIHHLQQTRNYTPDIKRKKDACLSLLNQARLRRPEKNIPKSLLNESVGDTSAEREKIWLVPAGAYIEYLLALYEVLLGQHPQYSSYSLYAQLDETGFLELTQFLTVFYPSPEGTLSVGGIEMPHSSYTLSSLKLLESILPYYFAAYMQIEKDLRSPSELLWQTSEGEQADKVSVDLKQLFKQLTEPEDKSKKSGPKNKLLRSIMKEAQNDLAKKYYSHLEAAYE